MPIKLLTIVGARPQFVKAAIVSRAIVEHQRQGGQPSLVEKMVHTGQHFDANMSEVFFDELEIPRPDCNLGIGGGTHGQNTGRMLEKLEEVMQGKRPDWVLVYGDTDSTLAGALAAVKLHIPVAHVEAGLRSFNRRMPEEINRILTDHAADLLLTPTATATANLTREGIDEDRVRQVGDVMYDAALHYGAVAERKSRVLERLGLESGTFVLATVHRAENTDDPAVLGAIMAGLGQTARRLPVILPLHPRTARCLEKFGLTMPDGIRVIEPLGYLDMVMLEKHAAVIATDSGGVQKEAYFHAVPCVTLRHETEWLELVELGWNRLVSPLKEDISQAILGSVGVRGQDARPYGDGDAAEKVVIELLG